jgi:hypothetical protein
LCVNYVKREFKALVWNEELSINGLRVSIMEHDIEEAMKVLEEEYGEGSIFNLHNDEDAEKIRSQSD